MLNAISITLQDGDAAGALRATTSMERQGFVPATCHHAWHGGALSAWIHPSLRSAEGGVVETRFGTACCVGPVWYRGRFGSAALELLIEAVAATGHVDENALRGNFALFVRTTDHCLLLNDVLGFVRVYVSSDKRFYSTSWLATCAYAGGVELDAAAAAEYVLLGASHSDATVARGVTILPLAHAVDLTQGCLRPRLDQDTWDQARPPVSFDAGVDEIRACLGAISR
jgi:asparagine synthase (glutamine-hydrolysing)